MIGTLAIVFAIQVTVSLAGGAARYPSGLNPALCPNYPHCDNVLLAAYSQPNAGADDYYNNDIGHIGSGRQHHPSVVAGLYNQHHQLASYTEPGYPAGLSSSNCPNYPYCSHQVPAEALISKYYSGNNNNIKRYPAGITPQNCPNYPYCY